MFITYSINQIMKSLFSEALAYATQCKTIGDKI